MSAPPGEGYGQDPGQQYGQYAEQPQYDEQQPLVQGGAPEVAGAGKKKKRGYAAGAFEVGTGGNAPGAGQVQGGGPQYGAQYGQPQPVEPQQPAAQGYQYPQQGYPGQQPQQQQQQQQPPQPAYGGYQAPDQGYPTPGAAPGAAPGVAGITQGVGGMQIGGQPQQPSVPASQLPRAVLNQLYPTDLLNQPFNASELDLPPPSINLPPNVSPTHQNTIPREYSSGLETNLRSWYSQA